MQNVSTQYNPAANLFDEEPPRRRDPPLLLSSGYNSNGPGSSSSLTFAPTPMMPTAHIPQSQYTSFQPVIPMPSPHFSSTPNINHSHSYVDMPPHPTLGPGGFVPPASPQLSNKQDQRHFGPAPTAQRRRFHTTKKVKLTSGNLVLDCPVPPKFLQTLKYQDGEEFTHMRYTAATCDPNDFAAEHYTLRPQFVDGVPRETELFIVMTMYNVSFLIEGCHK
ncbi:hypothetical protein BGZ76_002312 [Entomortierella beljakovae]|nr:hypothetical protein BGZ76_002312 [Entomortierella beljakovae]